MDAQTVYRSIKDSVLVIERDADSWGHGRLGSGFAVGDGTLVVTNRHVAVNPGAVLLVRTLDGKVIRDVRVLRLSSEDDLAVIKLPEAVPPLELFAGKVVVGQEAAVLGNPNGLRGTLSTGVISGLRAFKPRGMELLQITVPLAHGASGSPLVDREGRVLGVVCSGFDDEMNVFFAVPGERLRTFLGRDLLPDAGESRAPSGPAGGLDVQKAPDGSITIIQKKKR